jgi:hypothetical protein
MTADPKTTLLDAADRRDFLWKTLDRYDVYIGMTITRAATVTALNTLIVGYVILKAGDILGSFGGHTYLRSVALLALGVSGLMAFGSTLLSFLALAPYLGANGAKSSSLIFFADVARHERAKFVDMVQDLCSDVATLDLAEQVHDVATGLDGKFEWLRYASGLTIGGIAGMLVLAGTVLIGAP